MSRAWTQARPVELARRRTQSVQHTEVIAEHLDPIAEDANRLAFHFNPGDRWAFLLFHTATGQFRVYSNQSGRGVRALLKKYLKPLRREEAR